MVKRIITLFGKEIIGLHEAAYLLAIATILSQVLALGRDKLLAYTFGAGHILDVYYASFRIPDMIYATLASMVAASILVPFFIKKSSGGEKYFIDHVFSAFFFAIIIVSGIVWVLMPYLVPHLFPGFAHDPSLQTLITASRIMLLSPILLGISNFLASITQMYNRFLIYAISPLLYNIGIIIGIVVLYPLFGIYGLTAGVILGAFMHMALQVPFVISKGLFPRIRFKINLKEIREVVMVSLPRTITLSSTQISTFFLVALATLMGEGAVSIFNFSFNLQSVPLAIIGVSYSSAAFPALAKMVESGDMKKYVSHMAMSARHIIFWSLPITILFIVLRAQIVRVILGAGRFDWSDTRLTAAMLALFTVSVVGQSLILLFVRAYYAEGKTMRPLLVNIISAVVIILLAYVLRGVFISCPTFAFFMESLLKVTGISGSIILVLALAYSTGVLMNTLLHWIMFHRDHGGFSGNFTPVVLKTFFQSFSASIIGGYIAFLFLHLFGGLFDMHKIFGVFLQGFSAGICGILAWALVLKLLKSEELHDVWTTLHQKIWKAKITPADAEPL
jgi:putative peptidoglycan lipid II flippase